jgi:exonuclease III
MRFSFVASSIFSSLAILTTLFPGVYADTECPAVSSFGDRRKDKNTLRLVQYNAEWLFIDYYSSANCPGSGCPWHNDSAAQTHMNYVTSIIQDLQPDIVNICEVEGCDELNTAIKQLDSSYVPYLKQGTDTSTGQNVGILTRIDPLVSLYRSEEKVAYPLANAHCGSTSASGTTGVSKHYITEYKWGAMQVAFIGAHLLAYPTDPARCVQREGQAQVLQHVISSYIQKGDEVIVSGDMNDFDANVLDINSNKPISRVLNILKGLDGDKKGTYELTNIASKVVQNERFSDWWDSDSNCNTQSQSDYSMIDHVLMTPLLSSYVVNAFFYHGYKEYCGKWNSDHYPVVVDFVF